jgi:hypothetical protein
MTDLPPEKQKAAEDLLASLHRMALKVLETPPAEREEVYEIMRQSWSETATDVLVPPDLADQYMIWLRALVDMIERGGGGKGGTA